MPALLLKNSGMEYKKLRFNKHTVIYGPSSSPLGVRMVLYPDLEFQPVDIGGTPIEMGQWHFLLARTEDFVNLNVLDGWVTANPLLTQTIPEYVGDPNEASYNNLGGSNPNVNPLDYKPSDKPDPLLVYSDLDALKPTIFYSDSADNVAQFSPLMVLDPNDNSNYELIVPSVNTLRVLSYDADAGKAKVEIIGGLDILGELLLPNPRQNTMYWEADQPYTTKGDTAIRMDLLPGIYSVAMIARVDSPEYAGGTIWPFAKRSFVFEVYELP